MLDEIPAVFDEHLRELIKVMVSEGVTYAARGFSGMVGRPLTVSRPQVRLAALTDIPSLLGGPETEAVGIYLRSQGEMAGQIMLVLEFHKALELVDLILGVPAGTTTGLGTVERSALAELGNLTGTFFLNAMAAFTGFSARPTPPAVVVDMIGAILDVIITTYGEVSKHVLMLEVSFMGADRRVQADFWVIPDPATLEAYIGPRRNG